ncbi:MAG: transketolase C-terminal domain-containing protein, partial [Flavobacteriaceae bacterium]
LSPNDGATHHGLFDLAYLRCVPGVVVMAPANEDELADMMATGLAFQGPAFIRYPRGNGVGTPIKETPTVLEIGKALRCETDQESGNDIDIWAIGAMVADAEELAANLREQGIQAGVVNARFVKPLDTQMLAESAQSTQLIVTMEDHVITGGLGTAVMEGLQAIDRHCPVERIGWPDDFIEHGSSVSKLRAENGLSPEAILERVLAKHEKLNKQKVESLH